MSCKTLRMKCMHTTTLVNIFIPCKTLQRKLITPVRNLGQNHVHMHACMLVSFALKTIIYDKPKWTYHTFASKVIKTVNFASCSM